MQLLFDHVTSVIVSLSVVMVLFAVQMRAQRSSISRTLMHMAKEQTLSLADVLEQDLVNVGFNRNPKYETRVLEYETTTFNGMPVTGKFTFWGRRKDGQAAPVRYTVQKVGEATIGETIMPQLRWEREVCQPGYVNESAGSDSCNAGGFEQDGQSTSTLTRFYIKFPKSDEDGAYTDPATIDRDARTLEASVYNAVAPGVGQINQLESHRQLIWRVTLRPGGLRGSVS